MSQEERREKAQRRLIEAQVKLAREQRRFALSPMYLAVRRALAAWPRYYGKRA